MGLETHDVFRDDCLGPLSMPRHYATHRLNDGAIVYADDVKRLPWPVFLAVRLAASVRIASAIVSNGVVMPLQGEPPRTSA